jgi:hypothetical protein
MLMVIYITLVIQICVVVHNAVKTEVSKGKSHVEDLDIDGWIMLE